MTTSTHRAGNHAQPIRGATELVQAIPYLIGYHPAESLVLVGLRRGRLVVTARLDLADVDPDAGQDEPVDGPLGAITGALLEHTVARAVDGGAREFVLVVYTEADDVRRLPDGVVRLVPGVWRRSVGDADRLVPRSGAGLVGVAAAALDRNGGLLLDALLVRSRRCWSYLSTGPADGWDLDGAPSPFVAEATVAGTAPRSDRAAVAASLDPLCDQVRAELEDPLADAEVAAMSAERNGGGVRHERASRRAVLSAVQACHRPGWTPPDGAELARLAVALTNIQTRDGVWLVIEAGSVDGRPLMLELARRCPPPYDVAPLFLYGWACWRAGNSMLAGEAARRAVATDPAYNAARMLVDAVDQGVDPHRVPQLRRPRRPR